MGGAPSPRIAQETLRRTTRICARACRRVQSAQRLRSRASGADGLFCAYKAEVAGSRPAAPTRKGQVLSLTGGVVRAATQESRKALGADDGHGERRRVATGI